MQLFLWTIKGISSFMSLATAAWQIIRMRWNLPPKNYYHSSDAQYICHCFQSLFFPTFASSLIFLSPNICSYLFFFSLSLCSWKPGFPMICFVISDNKYKLNRKRNFTTTKTNHEINQDDTLTSNAVTPHQGQFKKG